LAFGVTIYFAVAQSFDYIVDLGVAKFEAGIDKESWYLENKFVRRKHICDAIENYLDGKGTRDFLAVVGSKGLGKTSTLDALLRGKPGVCRVRVKAQHDFNLIVEEIAQQLVGNLYHHEAQLILLEVCKKYTKKHGGEKPTLCMEIVEPDRQVRTSIKAVRNVQKLLSSDIRVRVRVRVFYCLLKETIL
jgi:hypothetical protein